MADLASEWGFQAFGEAANYPANDAFQVEETGRRAKKTDKKRQRQLEELVAGVVRLDHVLAGNGPIHAFQCADPMMHLKMTDIDGQLPYGTMLSLVGTCFTDMASGEMRKARRKKMDLTVDEQTVSAPATESGQPPASDAAVAQAQLPVKQRRCKNKFKSDTPASAAGGKQEGGPQKDEAANVIVHAQQLPGKTRRRKNKFKPDQPPIAQLGDQAQVQASAAATDAAAEQRPPGRRKLKAQRAAAEAAALAAAFADMATAHAAPSQNAPAAAATADPPDPGVPSSGASTKKQRQKAAVVNGKLQPPTAAEQPAATQAAGLGLLDGNGAETPGPTPNQKKKQAKQRRQQQEAAGKATAPAAERGTAGMQQAATAAPGAAKPKGSSGLLDRMRSKLQGGRFRWLNEQLYTSSGDAAFRLMQEDPDLYRQYHEGFRQQAADWPQQPVAAAIEWLKGKPKDWVVADFGCGDAQLAAQAAQTVHSFDLVAGAPGVVACNMAAVPLPDATVDAAVFCLALMGTDYGSFLQEAHRVLKDKGWLWVCEVRSRFAGQAGGGDSAVGDWVMVSFTRSLQQLGFKLTAKKVFNKMFIVFELRKQKATAGGCAIVWPVLKSCVYKKQ